MATSPPEIYTLSLHDALPIYCFRQMHAVFEPVERGAVGIVAHAGLCARRFAQGNTAPMACQEQIALGQSGDRKSTRLNSSHTVISYAVFCLKKKKTSETDRRQANPPLAGGECVQQLCRYTYRARPTPRNGEGHNRSRRIATVERLVPPSRRQ